MQTEIIVTNSLYSTAATFSKVYFFYWMQLHEKIGPIVIFASHVITDVVTVSIMYIVILIAFSSGIILILGTERITKRLYRQNLLNRSNDTIL